jgi:2-isopropylmalate synthase
MALNGKASHSVDDKQSWPAWTNWLHHIEGGWPGSNPKDAAFFERARKLNWQHARLAAFGSTTRKDTRPEDDANIQALEAAGTPVVTLVGKSWDLHVHEVLETSLEENLEMIVTWAYTNSVKGSDF